MCENIVPVSLLLLWTSKRRLSNFDDYFGHWISYEFPGNEKKTEKATTVLQFKSNAFNI